MASVENAVSGSSTNWGSIAAAGAMAGAGLMGSFGSANATQAQGYYQQAAYALQAVENLRLAGLRADKAIEYAKIQADRTKLQTEFEALNFKVQGNTLLRSLAKTNAAARARAAANGIDIGSGSPVSVQEANVVNTYRDVQLTDLNALVARVFGMEDATNILKAGLDNAYYEREAAISNTNTLLKTGEYAVKTSGLMANATLLEGGLNFIKTFPTTALLIKAGFSS